MVPLVNPNTTVSVLILSGLLKIAGKERFINSHQSQTSKTSRYLFRQLMVKIQSKKKKFLIIIICLCLCSVGQICLERFKGMLIKPHVKMPRDQLHSWAAPHTFWTSPPPSSTSPCPNLKSRRSNVAGAQKSSPSVMGRKKKRLTLTNSQVQCRERGLLTWMQRWEACASSARLRFSPRSGAL